MPWFVGEDFEKAVALCVNGADAHEVLACVGGDGAPLCVAQEVAAVRAMHLR